MATGAVKDEIEGKGRKKQGYQAHAEASRRRRNTVADEVSESDPSSGPQDRAREAVEGKSDDAQLGRARQSGRDGVQLAQKPSAQLKCSPMGDKYRPGAVNQGA